MQMWMEPTNNGTSVKLRDGFWMGPPKRRQQFYRECGENTWALHKERLRHPLAATLLPPCGGCATAPVYLRQKGSKSCGWKSWGTKV